MLQRKNLAPPFYKLKLHKMGKRGGNTRGATTREPRPSRGGGRPANANRRWQKLRRVVGSLLQAPISSISSSSSSIGNPICYFFKFFSNSM
ncbi:unnamed protein product [Cuscuta campestris]|uniref:Uncharacterized protein n=1 Tax=Cuscuta campestris TaxID=132261 RepID=A0A484LN20_9ASTE|nr:unnamed protein product [Cuscuta campestris]